MSPRPESHPQSFPSSLARKLVLVLSLVNGICSLGVSLWEGRGVRRGLMNGVATTIGFAVGSAAYFLITRRQQPFGLIGVSGGTALSGNSVAPFLPTLVRAIGLTTVAASIAGLPVRSTGAGMAKPRLEETPMYDAEVDRSAGRHGVEGASSERGG